MWSSLLSDGTRSFTVKVEYGADISKLPPDINALKKYTSGSNRVLVWDPDQGVGYVHDNYVRWDAQGGWAAYHYDDINRIVVDPYDPAQPNDPNTNPYYVGLMKLSTIFLGTTLQY